MPSCDTWSTRISFNIDDELIREIDQHVGRDDRKDFIRRAIEASVQEHERQRRLRSTRVEDSDPRSRRRSACAEVLATGNVKNFSIPEIEIEHWPVGE